MEGWTAGWQSPSVGGLGLRGETRLAGMVATVPRRCVLAVNCGAGTATELTAWAGDAATTACSSTAPADAKSRLRRPGSAAVVDASRSRCCCSCCCCCRPCGRVVATIGQLRPCNTMNEWPPQCLCRVHACRRPRAPPPPDRRHCRRNTAPPLPPYGPWTAWSTCWAAGTCGRALLKPPSRQNGQQRRRLLVTIWYEVLCFSRGTLGALLPRALILTVCRSCVHWSMCMQARRGPGGGAPGFPATPVNS